MALDLITLSAFIVIILAAPLGYVSQNNSTPVFGQGIPNPAQLSTGLFRIDNVQLSSENAPVGDIVGITFELKGLINANMTITPVPVVERIITPLTLTTEPISNATFAPINSDNWQVVNATHLNTFVLTPGERLPFQIEIKAVNPGTYYVYPAFEWSFTDPNGQLENGTYYGTGWKVEVKANEAQLEKCQSLAYPKKAAVT